MNLPVHRFSADEYDEMIRLGLLEGKPVELIEGTIVDMPAQGLHHITIVRRLTKKLAIALADDRRELSVQSTTGLGPNSRPEPDLAVVGPEVVVPTQAELVIEVAETSWAFDSTTKQRLYAAAGVPDYWIVDIPRRTIWVHTDPGTSGYGLVRRFESGQAATSPHAPCSVDVAQLFEGL